MIQQERTGRSSVNPQRHKRSCSICAHPQLEEIDSAFVSWRSPIAIVNEFGLGDRTSIHRHATAMGLYEKRRRNVRAALEKIIERAGDVDVTASAVVAAIQAFSKINSDGEWIDRSEDISLRDQFARMTPEELESYARSGELPDWFRRKESATSSNQRGSATDGR
jgi:hypothetical protein